NNLIGANGDGVDDAAERNVISGNIGTGINIENLPGPADNNVIAGNYVGTDAAGDVALGNGQGPSEEVPHGEGILDFGHSNRIEGNVISANRVGVMLGADCIVLGNFIGTDATGTASLGNFGYGIFAFGGSRITGNVIAGTRFVNGSAQGVGVVAVTGNTV